MPTFLGMNDERWVRALSLIEGLSYVVLLGIAMPLKYLAGFPLAVKVAGTAHGVLFVALGLAIAWQLFSRRWSFSLSAYVMAIALVPLGALYLERRWQREGQLGGGTAPVVAR